MIAAGGTGGHLFPALAVAQQLRRVQPDAQVVFVGGERGLESRIVPAHGFALQTLKTGRLKGTSVLGRARTVLGLAPVLTRALRLLGEFRPSVVVGAGGYASAPVAAAAALRRVPVVLLEQNAIAGLTNRLLARLAHRVVTAFPETQRLPASRALTLGNPIRPALLERLASCVGDRGSRPPRCLLVLGGSQGARRVNQLVTEALPLISNEFSDLRVIHQTGATDRETVADAYRAAGVDARVEAFVEDMAAAYCEADLMLGRSGATTVAELAVAGLPAVFMPYPFAADGHQAANARALATVGAALESDQEQLTSQQLAEQVCQLLAAPARLRDMSQAMLQWARPQAAAAVVDLLLEAARPG